MYKNQLQELAQRSCFNLPSYTCIREGPDHAPRFKASVNFNGEVFEGPCNCTTLRQAEHSAAEVALNTLSIRGPSRSVTAKVIDETGVYKNLLQETAHRAGLNLPTYTTVRSGPGHVPVFSSTVEVAGMLFKGEPAKTKKQAEKNAALAAWSALKQMPNLSFSSSSLTNKETTDSNNEEQERVVVARVLSKYSPKDETKQGKQRIMNQARKGIVSGFSVNNSKCRYGSSTENSMLYQQWRSIAMSSDFHPSQYQNRVFAPLRPAAVRPTENPSLLTPNKSIPVQVKTNLQVNKQEVSVPIQEHQQEEEEWLHGKSFVNEKKKTTEKDLLNQANPKPNPNYQIYTYPQLINNPMPDPRTTTNQTHIRSIGYVPALPPLPSIRPSITRCMAQTTFSYPRDINTFGCHHSHNMAPSVNIRSVVPVCSAPPPMMPTSLSSNASKPVRIQEVSSSPSVSATKTTVTTQHTEKEVQEASRKLSNLQL